MSSSSSTLVPIPLNDDANSTVVDAQLHPTRPWILLACSSGLVTTKWTRSGETLYSFQIDQSKHGILKSARFFDASTLLHVSLLPAALVAEARATLIIAICAKGIVVYDCVTRLSVSHTPPVFASGSGHARASGGALSGAFLGVSCEHIVVGTTFGSLFTVGVRTGSVSAFSGTTKLHEKSIVSMVSVTGRPSPELHRARIATGCAGGLVALWEILCESPVYKVDPRALVENPSSPVLDLRFDSTRNRLACCFANGSARVWGLEEQSQEETMITSISKGFSGGQIAIPRASSWNAPDESLLMITQGRGQLALVVPSSGATKLARQLQRGMVTNPGPHWDATNKQSGADQAVVAVRTVCDLAAFRKATEDYTVRITRFWQHPLSPELFLIQTTGKSSSIYLFRRAEQESLPSLHHDLFPGASPVLAIVDGRLVTKSGAKFQTERSIAALSPYMGAQDPVLPKAVKDWASLDAQTLLAVLDADKPVDALWAGPISLVTFNRRGNADALVVGFCWRDAQRYVVATYKKQLQTPESPPAQSLQVVDSGSGQALGFVQDSNGDCLALVGRQQEVLMGQTTALTESRGPTSRPGLLAFTSKSLRAAAFIPGAPSSPLGSSSSSFRANKKDQTTTTTMQHYYLGVYRVSTTNSPPLVEILVNQPIGEIVGDVGDDLFLVRFEPPEQLKRTMKPWSRFFRLSKLLRDKALVHSGPLLPAHRLVSRWEHDVQGKKCVSLAIAFDQLVDRIVIMDAMDSGTVRFRCSVFTQSSSPCVSLKWHCGTVFFATNEKIKASFVGSTSGTDECPTYVLAARGRNAHPGFVPKADQQARRGSLHVHDDDTRPDDAAFSPSPAFVRTWEEEDQDSAAAFPIPVKRPHLNWLYVLGVDKDSGDLILLLPSNGKIALVPLRHPLLRVGMLAAAGLSRPALQWTSSLDSTEARDEAVIILAKMGFPKQAALVPGASPVLLLDVCVKHRCVEEAVQIFHPKTKALAVLARPTSTDDAHEGLSSCQRLVLLLISEGRADVVASLVPKLKLEMDKKFCNAIIHSAKATQQSTYAEEKS